MSKSSFVNRWNLDVVDENYKKWLENPNSVEPEWNTFFEGFELGYKRPTDSQDVSHEDAMKQAYVIVMIDTYRSRGHTQAKINPLENDCTANPALSLETLGLSEADLDKPFHTGNFLGGKVLPLRDIITNLKKIYCGTTGCEFTHIQSTEQRNWIQTQIESRLNQTNYTKAEKLRAFEKVQNAEEFENFLHTRYVGQKRFSVEGGESLLACLDRLIEVSGDTGIKEAIIGMAHRGRLNVLVNTLGKDLSMIFKEFSPNYIPKSVYGDGDVKYHLGYNSVHKTAKGNDVKLHLAANPSHLEAVNAVVAGRARALQRNNNDIEERNKVLPILIHGDAAFIGQGVVAEVLNMSNLEGYTTGGTIHVVVNNQIGFTAVPTESRSGMYCTDIAKMIEAPIFHVNGDDPIAVMTATSIAFEYRQKFKQDAVIDIYCYRKYGHNESDEPKFTQPLLYNKISAHPKLSEVFSAQLINDGDLSKTEIEKLKKQIHDKLEKSFESVQESTAPVKAKKSKSAFTGSESVFQHKFTFDPVDTTVSKATLSKVTKALTTVPSDIKINPKIQRQLEAKTTSLTSEKDIDWGYAESLAFGTLLNEGTPIRLSGQDSARGTFSHRHAVLYDVEKFNRYVPLNHIDKKQAKFCVHNSSLSEAGILGFDYGYSLDYPQMLCIWEAQFGDFSNGAQVIIDQFISSSESKWQQVSGIVLLLPHGYEGQGPEHSSARLERYLQLCAEDNMQVCNVTTPAQYFHLLRRQMKRKFLKPLIIMAPKSLLRHKECVSTVEDLTSGKFEEILDDNVSIKKAERVILCSGKVYYDLKAYRDEAKINNTSIIRIEQLYPLHKDTLSKVLKKHKDAKHIVWCQEEPSNMGAWSYVRSQIEACSGKAPIYAGRDEAASPAVGSLALHKQEQAALIKSAFELVK